MPPHTSSTVSSLAADTPIVVFGDDWGRHVSTMQHLFRHVAQNYPVVWVNSIGHRLPELRAADIRRAVEKARAIVSGRKSAAPGGAALSESSQPLRIIHPRVLPWHHYRAVRAFNTASLVRAVKSALAELELSARPLVVTGSPPTVDVLGRLDEVASVYLCMDDFLHLPNVSAGMLGPLEQRLLGRVDALVATAAALVESKRPASGVAHYLPQGVNYRHFAEPREIPPELRDLPRPIVGFAGGLTTPVDLALVRRLATEFATGSVVLIGPVYIDVETIAAPNVHVLGPRPYTDLPAYVQAFDVGLIPYVLNAHTLAVDPLKLLEYLAAGIPVVALDLPEIRKYAHAVSIASTHDEFVDAVRRAATDHTTTPEQRRAVAREHDWSARAARLLGILGDVVAERSGRGAAPRA